MKSITFNEQDFKLHPSGILYWPAERLAVVSDLHLEKGSFFAAKGQFIPPHDSEKTLSKLLKVLEAFDVTKLILLGDSFHDNDGSQRLSDTARDLFDQLCSQYEIIWVKGNHDDVFVPCHVHSCDEFMLQNIVFRHEAQNSEVPEISGHFHPKARVKLEGRKITKPCLVHDAKKMILPAFGTYTGGLDVSDPVFKPLFAADIHYHLITGKYIYTIKNKDLYQ